MNDNNPSQVLVDARLMCSVILTPSKHVEDQTKHHFHQEAKTNSDPDLI